MKSVNKCSICLIIAFLIVFAAMVIFQIIRRNNIEKLNRFSKMIEQRDSVRREGYKVQAFKNLDLGNLIAYPNSEKFNGLLIKELAYEKYGVLISTTAREGELDVVKPIMDSVIFKKYGRNFYDKLLIESDSIVKFISQNMTIDGYYLIVKQNNDDVEKTRKYIFDELKAKKIIPFKQNAFYPRELKVDFIVDKNGGIKKIRVLHKYNRKIDDIVVDLLTNLPFKWTPGRVNGKIVEFREEIVFEFGIDPFYRKVD